MLANLNEVKICQQKVQKQELLLIVNGAEKKYIKIVIITIKTNTIIVQTIVKRKHNGNLRMKCENVKYVGKNLSVTKRVRKDFVAMNVNMSGKKEILVLKILISQVF